jgi:DNA-directed RNA polymerase specialized sigma24 family protein
VALNEARRLLRRAGRERRVLPTAGVVAPDSPDHDLWEAVARLPTRQRTAVVLRYVADMPENDIAQIMGIARGTVAASLAAARKSLAQVLGEPVAEETPS